MKGSKGRFLASLLAVSMVMQLVPTVAFGADEMVLDVPVMEEVAELSATSGTCGDNATWEYDSSTYTLTISGSGDMWDYEYGASPFHASDVEVLVVGNKITHIGDCAFFDCEQLTSVEIPSSVESIGYMAFRGCTGLESITLNKGLKSIGDYAFTFCDSLKALVIPEGVTYIGFCSINLCENLTSIALPSTLSNCGERPFAYNDKLEEIIVAETNPYYTSDEGVLLSKDMTMLVQFPNGKTQNYALPDSVAYLEMDAFGYDSYSSTLYACDLTVNINSSFKTQLENWGYNVKTVGTEGAYTIAFDVEGENGLTTNVSKANAGDTIYIYVKEYEEDELWGQDARALVDGSLTYNNIPVEGNQFIMPDCDVTLRATFTDGTTTDEEPVYQISIATPSITDATRGYIEVSATEANAGETITITAYPNDGYALEQLTYNGTLLYDGSVLYSSMSFVMPSKDVEIGYTFQAIEYLDVSEDTWAFSNSAASFGYDEEYTIPIERYKTIFYPYCSIDQISQSLHTWFGSCYGMSLSALSFYNNVLSPEDFADVEHTNDLTIYDWNAELEHSVLTYIETLHLVQLSSTVSAMKNEFYGDIEGMCNRIINQQPTIISIYDDDSGHAVIGYRVSYSDDTFTKGKIYVYDCNYPNNNQRYITFEQTSTGVYTWNYDISSSVNWNDTNGRITYDLLDGFDLQAFLSGDEEVMNWFYDETLWLLSTTTDTFRITNEAGQSATIENFMVNETQSNMDVLYSVNPTGIMLDDNEEIIAHETTSGLYYIEDVPQTLSGGEVPLDFSISSNTSIINVSLPELSTIGFSDIAQDNSNLIITSIDPSGDFNVQIKSQTSEVAQITLTGDMTDQIIINQTTTGVELSGVTTLTAVLEDANGDLHTVSFDNVSVPISLDLSETATGNNLVVKSDQNNDGAFETDGVIDQTTGAFVGGNIINLSNISISNNKVTFKVEVVDTTVNVADLKIALALYNTDGQMISLNIESIVEGENTISIDSALNYETAKLFTMDANNKPILTAIELPIE